jgi:hypothetical protein
VLLFVSFNDKESRKLTGHWIIEKDLYDIKTNDTLIFTKTRYTDKLYQWGGALSGIELTAENYFYEYHNVLCSSETDPVRYHDEKWGLQDRTIKITGSHRKMDWKMISMTNKELRIIVLAINPE